MEPTENARLEEIRAREMNDNIPLLVVAAGMIVLGIIGNSTAIAFYGFSERKIVTNILIYFLAVNDLIACIVFCDEIIVLYYTFTFTNIPACKAIFVANNWVVITSVALMTVIAIDRYRRICHPFSWQLTIRSAKVTVGYVVLFTFCFNLREAFLADSVTKYIRTNDNSTIRVFICTHTDDKSLTAVIKASNIFNMITYITLFLVIIIAYSLIIKKLVITSYLLHRHQRNDITNSELSDISLSRGNCNEAYETSERNNTGSLTLTETEDSSVNKPATTETTNIVDVSEVTIQPGNVEGNEHTIESESLDSKRYASNLSVNNTMHTSSKATEIEKKITRMVAVMTIVSILGFMPYFTVVLFVPRHTSTEKDPSSMGKKIARQFYMLNSIVNPYIICYFNSKFRIFVKMMICKCFQK